MIYLLLSLLISFTLSATERITDFNSDITVHQDGSMTVAETIKVKGEADQIRRGIVRELPTKYKDRIGNYYNVGLDILEVKRDGQREPYHIEAVPNGKKIYIGSKERFLGPGYYTFDITYKTNRQLGFFDDHDELYWNVTGNGWRLPIDRASATVHLPKEIPSDKIKVEGYTGYQGSKSQEYDARVQADGDAYFQTTKPLNRAQGLTIVTSFPKGYIKQPSFIQTWWWFFSDNIHLFIAALGLLLLVIFYWWASIQVSRTQRIGTIIPLFYPPKNMTPGLVRYITTMKYDSKVLAADIVDMAVRGYLTIEYKPGLMWGGSYVLHKKEEPSDHKNLYVKMFKKLFSNKERVSLDSKNRLILQSTIGEVEADCAAKSAGLFSSHGFYTLGGVGISIITVLAMLGFVDRGNLFWLYIAGALYVCIIFIMSVQFRGYTKKGLSVKRDIDGVCKIKITRIGLMIKIVPHKGKGERVCALGACRTAGGHC